MTLILKNGLKQALAHPLLGRPSRKAAFLLIKFTEWLMDAGDWANKKATAFYWRLPYVKGIQGAAPAISKYYHALRHAVARLPHQPKISVLVPVYRVNPRYLEEALRSIAFQTYENWEACIVDDASGQPELAAVIERFAARHPGKVKFATNATNSHISVTSNRCAELATGEYLALLDHDDRLYPNSLGEMVRHINFHSQPDILYSDERVVSERGELNHGPFFKPAFSPFLHLAVNYTTHLTVYRADLFRSVGGFRKGFEGSQDHDLMLRMCEATKKPVVHVPFCLYQWRAHPQSTASGIGSKPYAAVAGERAIKEALERRGRPGKVEWEPHTFHYRVRHDLPKNLPLISILIPTKDAFDHVSRCLASVFEKSTYPNFEVLILDNGTTDAKCLELFARIERDRSESFRRLELPGAFNFAHLNNEGARAARGEYVVLLNNDTEVLEPNWLEEMLSIAQWPEVGSVGAKLLFPNGNFQHAGIVLSGMEIAANIGVNAPGDDHFYCSLGQTIHEVAAVTAACLMIKKDKYWQVGGLDEVWVPNGWGDVDFGVNLLKAGLTNVYTPYAVLRHYESVSRKATLEYFEQFYLRQKHGQYLLNDPYLSPAMLADGRYTIHPAYLRFDMGAGVMQGLFAAEELPY